MTQIISFSALSKFDTCKRAFHYSFDLALVPSELPESVATGVKGHTLLQSYYTMLQSGKSRDESLIAIQHVAREMISKQSMTETTSLIKAWSMVDNYIRNIDIKAKVSLVENRFLLPARMLSDEPILADIQIGFTPDVVFERSGGFMDVEDSKFIGKAWAKSKLDMFPQAKLYQIFLKLMGYPISRSGVRFFNTTTGKITEKYDPLTKEEEAILVEDFVGGLLDVLEHTAKSDEQKNRSRRTMNYSTCQYCWFAYPCKLEREGKSAVNTLKYQYMKNEYDYAK